MDQESCRHPACLCEVAGQQEYCSEECAREHQAASGDLDLDICNCGHAECEVGDDVDGATGDVAD